VFPLFCPTLVCLFSNSALWLNESKQIFTFPLTYAENENNLFTVAGFKTKDDDDLGFNAPCTPRVMILIFLHNGWSQLLHLLQIIFVEK
jgi:hypothetical protein